MPLNLQSLCGFPSLGAFKSSGHKPDDNHWIGFNLVKCAKGEEFKGYSNITFGGVNYHIDSKSRDAAVSIFGTWAVAKLNGLGLKNVALVPIPSSTLTEFGGACTANLLAEAASKVESSFPTSHVLAFNVAKQSDHGKRKSEGGEKPKRQSKDEIYRNLKHLSKPPAKQVVLIDDVCTQGFHLLAVATYLRNMGIVVEHALCVGRTVWTRVENPLSMPTEDLEATLFPYFSEN